MMTKFKSIIILTLTILLLLLIVPLNSSIATGTPDLSIDSKKTSLELGEEFSVSVNFNNNGSTECLGFDFGLKYDKDTLEVVSSNLVLNKGIAVINDKIPGTVNFVLISVDPVQYEGELFTVTFKVKQDAGGGKAALYLTSDKSEFLIEGENTGVNTNLKNLEINIQAPTKENNTGFIPSSNVNKTNEIEEQSSETNNNEEKEDNITTLKKDKINDVDTSEDEETIKNEESTSKSEKKEQTGLPTKVVAIILAISAIGLVSIFLMLKKKEK